MRPSATRTNRGFAFHHLGVVCSVCLLFSTGLACAAEASAVSLRWAEGGHSGSVQVDRGSLTAINAPGGHITENSFETAAAEPARVDLSVSPVSGPGDLPTLVTVKTAPRGFTFRVADVDAAFPIYLPSDHVVITTAADQRSYTDIVANIAARGGRSKLQEIAAAPESSFEAAASGNRSVKVQTWLGLSRDIRLFRIDEHLESFQPRFAGYDSPLPETNNQPATYAFQFGRGWGPRDNVRRSLDDGVLPILHGAIDDDSVHYDITLFASLERSALTASNVRGTDFLVADRYGHGHMFTPDQKQKEAARHDAEMNADEEVVLFVRAIATNRGKTPKYALLKTAAPTLATPVSPKLPAWTIDQKNGFGRYASGRVFAVTKLDGAPASAEEFSILLRPGASTVLEFVVPHRAISEERAKALSQQSFEARLTEVRTYWRAKLASAAQWQLPEPRMQEMTRAGLLHLDLLLYGHQPPAPLLPAIGVYTAIGSESAPIIQFMDSMGWHDDAARALDFFLEKQHDDGFIQNFNGYMLETGAVLWTLGEHYRYTHDDGWLRRVHGKVTKSWQYVRDWRLRNLRPELKGNGYGLLDGKTADPEDPYRSFMLNGYAYLGLARTAEMLRELAPDESAQCLAEANALKQDLRAAFDEGLEKSPVIPLSDGTWGRAAPPWTGYRGPVMMHADGGTWFTHGTMTGRDSLLGPLYLVFQEVLTPTEPIATELLVAHSELMTTNNVAFSQPYYSRHPWVHLQRGETKAFLAAWYGAVSALADRETYTFNEHFFPVSAHKTHEEAWFLMEARWMLYVETGDTLQLLRGVPRSYLKPGAVIGVTNAGSTFGPLSFKVTVSADGKTVTATVDCHGPRHPKSIELRLPHPDSKAATSVRGGQYSAVTESVRVDAFDGSAEITVRFP
ncbi:MAG: hypothetical protein ABIZ04_11855 [Opitutus sp.]